MSIKNKFKNKTQMKKYIGDTLRSLSIGEIYNSKLVNFLTELLTKYREDEPEKREVLDFFVDVNKYGQNHFMYNYITQDETVDFDSFSYTKAIDCLYDKKLTNKAKFKQSMRRSLENDLRELKTAWIKLMPFCELSGEKMTAKNSHVDHYGKMEFRHIINSFCESNNINYGEIKYISTLNGDYCADQELLSEFKAHHDKHCKLRVITATENLKRGKL